MKTTNLIGTALDWAVAKCEVGAEFIGEIDDPHFYSTDWALAGPIIERAKIELAYRPRGDMRQLHVSRKPDWAAGIYNAKEYKTDHICSGATPLIAAMRCYVTSKLGDDIELPEGLTHE